MKYYVGIDLGGTFVKAGVVDENYQIVAKASLPTDLENSEKLADGMVETVKLALKEAGLTMDDIESVGVCSPGAVDAKTGTVLYAYNLSLFSAPLGKLIEERIRKPVYLENDANVAAYGEVIAGAAKGIDDVIVITLGTGVGGGIIIDGKIYSGFNSFGAELGHMVIEHNGRPCTCGRNGCIEAYASATGLINMTKEAMEKHPSSKLWEIAPTLDDVDGKTAFDAMRAGDPVGKEVVDLYIGYLGTGLANFINIFQPEVLLIGGGICKEGETLLKPLREILDRETFGGDGMPKTQLKTCELGNDAGTIGAAMLFKLHQ